MKLFARRKSVVWWLFWTATIFAALGICAFATDDAIIFGGRGCPSRVIHRQQNPEEFLYWARMYIFYAVLGCSLAFVRIVPVEDWIGRFRERTKATVREKGYDAQPAPLWSYVFLVGFLALIVFIGWKVMYAD